MPISRSNRRPLGDDRSDEPLCSSDYSRAPANLTRWQPPVADAFPLCSGGVTARARAAPVEGTARLGERTKHLVKRLRPGDIAVIDHVDIDRIAAEELIAAGVAAVLNASPSSTGRYPNAGPLMLTRAGVRLVDAPDAGLFDALKDGERGADRRRRDRPRRRARCSTAACSAPPSWRASWPSSASGSTRRWPNSPKTPSPTCARRPTC